MQEQLTLGIQSLLGVSPCVRVPQMRHVIPGWDWTILPIEVWGGPGSYLNKNFLEDAASS